MRCCLLSPSFFVCPLKLPSSRTGLFLGLLYSGEHGRRVKKRESFFSGEKKMLLKKEEKVFKCTFTKKRGLVLEARQWKRERARVGKGPGGCIKHGKQSFKIADCKCPTLASYFHLIFFPFFYCDPVSGTSSSLSKKKAGLGLHVRPSGSGRVLLKELALQWSTVWPVSLVAHNSRFPWCLVDSIHCLLCTFTFLLSNVTHHQLERQWKKHLFTSQIWCQSKCVYLFGFSSSCYCFCGSQPIDAK